MKATEGIGFVEFPSPRGVELHKPRTTSSSWEGRLMIGFRPLAGLSCINRIIKQDHDIYEQDLFPSPRGVELHKPDSTAAVYYEESIEFPSPRGVELHKPLQVRTMHGSHWLKGFRPLAGLSCINLLGTV